MRFVRESDSADPEDARTVEIQPEDPLEFRPVRRYLSDTTSVIRAGGAVDHTHRWTWADRAEWALCWVGPVVAIIAALWLVGMVVAQVFR